MIHTDFPWIESAADSRVIVGSLEPLHAEGRIIATFHGDRDGVRFPLYSEAAANAALAIRACNALKPHMALLAALSRATGDSETNVVGRLLLAEGLRARRAA